MRDLKRSIIIVRILLILIVIAIGCYVEFLQYKTEQEHEKLAVSQSLSTLRGKIESTINSNVELVKGLATHIAINPNITQEEFYDFVAILLKSKSNIRNIAAAKDFVITHIYPLKGNEKAFGLNYRLVPEQFESIQKAIENNEIILAGPLELVQGGVGIIGRLPVSIDERNWGIVSIVMDFDTVMQSLQLNSYSDINISIRGKDAKGANGDVFYGDPAFFNSPIITQTVNLPYGSRVISAQPKKGWMTIKLHWVNWLVAFIISGALLYNMHLRLKNVTLAKEKQASLAHSEEKFRNFFNLHTVVMLIVDELGFIKDSNVAAQKFYGYPQHILNGLNVTELETDVSLLKANTLNSQNRAFADTFTSQQRLASGAVRDVKIYSKPVELDGQRQLFSIVFDITKQVKHEQQWRLFEKVYQHAQEGIFVMDEHFVIVSTNPAFEKITGYTEKEILGKTPSILDSDMHDQSFYENIRKSVLLEGSWRGEIWNKSKSGVTFPQISSIAEVRNDANKITHFIAVFFDITRQKQSEEKLEKLAHFDQLTGLPNRLTLKLHLGIALEVAKRKKTQVALLFLDLDRFKVINDSLGHEAGDELLTKVGERLKERLRAEDILARLGGDEFVILVTDYKDEQQLAVIAADLCAQLRLPFAIASDIEANLGASIGIAQFPKDSRSADELLKFADASMYKAKKMNEIDYIFYNKDITQEASSRLTITTEIKRAIVAGEFELFLQPQFNLSNGHLLGAEALIRWHHPQKGFLTPDKFIPLAESTGAIKLITEWVVDSVFNIAANWQKEGRNLTLSFNVSAIELADHELFNRILEKTRLHPELSQFLVIEIVESALIENLEYAKNILSALRESGFKVAIDDFGTGFSSLSYLGQLPVDILKIDRIFVQHMASDVKNGIVKSIIDLANNFSLSVTAEGIESPAHLQALLRMGCEVGQGYHYSKAISQSVFRVKYS